MRIFMFMGLPYQGKSTAASTLKVLLEHSDEYKNREIMLLSTDVVRSITLRENFPSQNEYTYTKKEETIAWKRYIAKIMEFVAMSPANSVLILDGTFTSWAKIVDVFDALTLNIHSYANTRIPLVIDIVHIGSQYGEKIWLPTDEKLNKDPLVAKNWFNRCAKNESLGIASRIPEEVLRTKIEELRDSMQVLIPTCKHFMKSYHGLLYIARHFLPHHPSLFSLDKLI